jgi:hypothetical protein
MNLRLASLAVVAAGMSLLTSAIYAQSPVRVTTVSGGSIQGNFENKVVSALTARLSATTRYTIGTQTEAELEASVVCFDISTLARDITGGVCSFTLYYWPKELDGLYCLLGAPILISSGEAPKIGESIFESLVSASTEKELSKHLATMNAAVSKANKK